MENKVQMVLECSGMTWSVSDYSLRNMLFFLR